MGLDMGAMMVCGLVTSGVGFVDGRQDLVSLRVGIGMGISVLIKIPVDNAKSVGWWEIGEAPVVWVRKLIGA